MPVSAIKSIYILIFQSLVGTYNEGFEVAPEADQFFLQVLKKKLVVDLT